MNNGSKKSDYELAIECADKLLGRQFDGLPPAIYKRKYPWCLLPIRMNGNGLLADLKRFA